MTSLTDPFPGFLPFQQSQVYAEAAACLGARLQWLSLDLGFALAVERGPFRLVSRGPVWTEATDVTSRTDAVRRLARHLGVTVVTPETPVAGPRLIPLVTSMHHAIWDLRGDLRAGMAGKWRNRLSRAERAGLAVAPTGRATLAELITAEAAQRTRRHYHALPSRFTEAVPDTALRIWEWRPEGRLEAAMAFVRHGSSATYHLGWGSDLARSTGAQGLMLARAAESLRAEGACWLDLGTVDTDAAPGLARFKLGTGAALCRLGATLLVLP